MPMVCMCESCGAEPPQVANCELLRGGEVFVRTTLCLDCLSIAENFPPDDPRVIALFNRVEDFKAAWPDRAKFNLVMHAGSVVEDDPERAVAILRDGLPRRAADG